ncbi:amino acid transporter [Xylaria sp. CBS 124048]|nr:amino acid transporter [Xylaria sp. CBS 124048]
MASKNTDNPETRPLLPRQQHEPTTASNGSATAGDVDVEENRGFSFKRNLGTPEAFAVVVGIVIGSGIFTSPGSIDTNVPSPGAALLVWLVGGVLAWTGASTMAELGTTIPGEGGVQPYLRYIFGDVFGFLAAWTWIVAVMPATQGILGIVFVESIFSSAGVTDQGDSVVHKVLAVLVISLVSVATSVSTKTTTRLNRFFVIAKFASIAAVVVAGVTVVFIHIAHPHREDVAVGGRDWFTKDWFGIRPTLNPDGSITDWGRMSQWELLGHYSTALYGALWAYSGWDKAIYISNELSAPAKQLPLAINSAIPTIICCFILTNAAYYILLPWDVVSTTDSVAVTAITRLLGQGVGILAAVLICLVVAGSMLGNAFIAGRMTVAAANQDWLPRALAVLGRVGIPKTNDDDDDDDDDDNDDDEEEDTDADAETDETASDAPINATILQTVLSAFYILFGSFRALLTFNGLGEYSFFFLAVVGAIVLRFREPALERPYKPFLLVPVVFALVSGFVVARGAIFEPMLAAVLVALWVVGVAVYWGRKEILRRTAE